VGEVVELNATGVLSLVQANERVQIIIHFTKPIAQKVESLINQLQAYGAHQPDKTSHLEHEIELQIEAWNNKIRKLGGHPKGMWLVDFDCGDGYLCWKYPEPEVLYWHDYKSGFPGRVLLTERDLKRQLKKSDFLEDLIDQL
jgi:hypothetical protein